MIRLFFFLFAIPFISQAEISSPFFLSQGGAGGASLKEDFSYLLNPATIAFQNKSKGAIAFSFKNKKKTALASFLDIKTKIPMAVTYQRYWSDSFKKSEKDKMIVSSGLKVSPYLSFGIKVEKELEKPIWNGGLGSILRFGNQISFALFLDQILKIEEKNQRSLSLGIYHNWKHFLSTKLDISKTAHKKWIVRGGFESFFQNFFSVRLGGTWFQKTKETLISGGFTFYSPRLVLEYGIEKDQKQYQQAVILSLSF